MVGEEMPPAERISPRSFWERYQVPAVAVLTILVLLIGFAPGFDEPAGPMDEGMVLVYPEMLLHGKLPYRDFETFYGPGNPAALAVAYSAFGTNVFVERAAGLLYRLLALVAVFAIAQRWGKTIAAGCTLIAGYVVLPSLLPAYAWFGAIACGVWSLWFSGKPESSWRCFAGGLLAGLALLFRPDVGPAMIISAVPLLHAISRPRRWRYAAGGAIALLPLAALALVIGIRPLVDNMFLYPVIYSGAGRRLPILSAEPYVLNLFVAHLAAVVINITAGVLALRAGGGSRARLLLAIAIFGLGLTPQAAQRLDSIHLLSVAFISLGLLPLSFLILASRGRAIAVLPGKALLAIAVVAIAVLSLAPELLIGFRGAFAAMLRPGSVRIMFIEGNGRWFPLQSPTVIRATVKLIDKLNAVAVPGERLFVGPADLRRTNYNNTFLYHMFPKLVPASYFLEMNPLSANRPNSRLASDVQSADWVVLDRMTVVKEANRSSEFGSDAPNAVVRNEFDPVAEYGPLQLYRHKR